MEVHQYGLTGTEATAAMPTLRRPALPFSKPPSLPSQRVEMEVVSGTYTGGNGGGATLSSGGLGPAVFGISITGGTVTVSGTAIGGNGGSGLYGGNGASVSLFSNGGANDAIGGATSGTLNLTQTAIGGNGGSGIQRRTASGNASSTLIGTNPFGALSYNLNTYATGGNGGTGIPSPGGTASSTTTATSSVDGGSVSGISQATGGKSGGYAFGSGPGGECGRKYHNCE